MPQLPIGPSLRRITDEIYGNENAGLSLRQCFVDASGEFDPAYNSPNDQRQSEFSRYSGIFFTKDTDSLFPDNQWQQKTVNCTSNYDSGSSLHIEVSDGSWLSVSPSDSLYGNFSFTITIETNYDGYDRSQLIYIKYNENVVDTIYIRQYA